MDHIIGWLMIAAVTLGVGAVAVANADRIVTSLSQNVSSYATTNTPTGP